MCKLQGYKTVRQKTLEELYKGKRHELSKWVQETQADGVDCFV